MRKIAVLVLVLGIVGCSKKPTADEVCKKIESSGVGANCHSSQPSGLGANAVERVEFDLPSVQGKTGAVMRFDSEDKYTATENAFTGASALAGPHRYGSKRSLIFVQMNSGLSAPDGAKVKAIVDAL